MFLHEPQNRRKDVETTIFNLSPGLLADRNCGKPIKPGGNGSQEQMVYRFNDKGTATSTLLLTISRAFLTPPHTTRAVCFARLRPMLIGY